MKSTLARITKGQLCASIAAAGFLFTGSSSQAAILLHETFDNGVAGTEMNQPTQPTSDGKGQWFGSIETFYRGDGNLEYEIPYTMDNPGIKIRALDYLHNGDANGVDTLPSYILRFGTVRLEGWNASCAAFIRPRNNASHLGYGYRFSPVGTANPPANWNVFYVGDESGPATLVATLQGATPTLENLELRVRENAMQLYTNGIPLNTTPRPTQATAGSGVYQRALEIVLNASAPDVNGGGASIKVTIDNVMIESWDWATQPPFQDTPNGTTLVYEGFNYSVGDLNNATAGGNGWLGSYMVEPSAANLLPINALSTVIQAPGLTSGDLTVEGNRSSIITPGTTAPNNSRRSGRWINVEEIPAHLKSPDRTLIRATGQKIWMSALAQQEDVSKIGFFGVSLFDNHLESVFLGKASGDTGPGLVWRIEGKSPNTTALTEKNASALSLLVVCIEWNHDGTTFESYTTNTTTQVITTNHLPVNPDKMYLWVNPSLGQAPAIETADAVSIRSVNTATQNPFLHFNKVGFRGITCGGVVDEFRLGTTFRSVAPAPVLISPELSASRVGSNIEIRWQTASGFVLQESSSLSSPSWSTVEQTPATDGGDSVVTLDAAGAYKFFRLIQN